MSKGIKSTPAIAAARQSIRPAGDLRVDSTAESPAPASSALRQKKYRELTRRHVGRLLEKLFADFTGLRFHIVWAPTPAHQWTNQMLPTASPICCRTNRSQRTGCQFCGPRQLTHALRSPDGHRFVCHFGVRNYWFALRLREETVGIAYLQALDGHNGKPAAAKYSPRNRVKVLSQLEFARAARLLRFVVEHVQTASLADLRKADLTSAGRAVLALEKEQTRLHQALQQHFPSTSQVPRHPGPESHPEQIVQRMLTCIELDYGKPITLRHCAAKLRMNAAYLSDLFSRATGVPFKRHLTELRMAKAKTLLDDPTKTASEVAYAVGYSSEDRFRVAFKISTGLSPKLWRETMQCGQQPV